MSKEPRASKSSLGALLQQAWNAHRLRADRALAALGVTPPQYAALTLVAARRVASGADLARAMNLTPQTVSVIVGNLTRRDALSRAQRPSHGKTVDLALTSAGEALLARCEEAMEAVEAALVEGPRARRKHARKWLKRVAQAPADESESTDS